MNTKRIFTHVTYTYSYSVLSVSNAAASISGITPRIHNTTPVANFTVNECALSPFYI